MHVWSPPLDVKKPDAPPSPPPPSAPPEPSKDAAKEAAKPAEPPKAPDAAAPQDSAKPAEPKPGEPAKPADETKPGEASKPAGDAKPGEAKDAGKSPKKDEPSTDAKLLVWNDVTMAGAAFVPWTKVQHPTLGEVEVGGWKPFVRVNPPDDAVAEPAKKHSDWLLQLGGMFASLKIGTPKVEDLGGGVWRVTVAVVNEGYLPSVCSMGERCRRPKPTRLDVDLRGATLIQGDVRHTWTRIEGSGGRREVKWLLQSEPGREITLHLWSERAGDDELVVALR
jgi:hypothetical protein